MSAVSIRLNPAATKASSNLKDVPSSTVQPKTFPPNASGATFKPELPKLRLLIWLLRCPNRESILIKTPANLGLDAFLPCERALRQKLLYPERGVQRYLTMRIANSRGRAMLPLKDVLSSRMKTSSHDGRNLAKSNPRRTELLHRREAPLETRTDLTPEATKDISGAMNAILADVV